MKIGVVILNWNGLSLLQRYLPSVVKHSDSHTVYLADNASTDNSIAWTRECFPMVKIIAMKENRGYAGGYNQAIQQVDEDLLCLLNNDIEVSKNWLNPIIDFFNNNTLLAACQPMLIDDNKREYFEYAGAAGGYLDQLAYPYCRGRIFNTIELNAQQYHTTDDLDWASGAALFVKKEAFLQVGGFDELYFAHQEEIDLCWRLRHAGYKIGVVTDAVVYHLGGGTLATQNPKKTFYNFRNSLFNILKNNHTKTWLVVLFIRMILDGLAAFKLLFHNGFSHFMAVLKAHGSFYLNFLKVIKKRKEVKQYSNGLKERKKLFSIVYQYFIKKKNLYNTLNH